jgi:hypothetical protein
MIIQKNRLRTIILFCFLLGISCSKKSDPTPAPVLSCAVTKRVETDPDRITTSVFTYDDQQRLIKIVKTFAPNPPGTPTTTANFTYTYSGTSVASVKAEFGNNGSTYVSTWTNENGRLTKIAVSGTDSEAITFTYDTQGRFKSSSLTVTGASGGTQASYDTGGAPVSVTTAVSVPASSFTSTDGFTATSVDAKQNPYAVLAKAINQPNFYDGFEGNIFVEFLTKGNPLKVTRVSTTNNSSVGTNDWTFTHEYNAKDYPTKITGSLVGSTYQTVTTFEYQNCN